jgi:phage gpG-like protein
MNSEANIAVLTNKVESLHEDMSEMKLVMRDIAAALTKLAIIDERQEKMSETQSRIFKLLDNHDGRIVALEKDDSHQKVAVDWVYKAVWAMVGVAAMYVAKLMGFM